MKYAPLYDYVVMNDDLDTAVQEVSAILTSIRCKSEYHKHLIENITKTFAE